VRLAKKHPQATGGVSIRRAVATNSKEDPMLKPPPSRVAQREARRKRVEEFKRERGIAPASEEYKARHLERGERVTALHIARYHPEMADKK
jgi:hypothetical protein